jgi:TusA-related sulfurtransferase
MGARSSIKSLAASPSALSPEIHVSTGGLDGTCLEAEHACRENVRGAKCPIPIVKAKKEVDEMQPGELLEVVSTDPGSLPDFKGWAQTSKTAVLKEQRTEKEGATDLYIHVLERK